MMMTQQDEPRVRIRELGVSPGVLLPGPRNSITDVPGVRVGHETIIKGDTIRTGVTAILPHADNVFQQKVPAAVYVGNGYGKAAGFLQVQELGTIETPIILTNTLSVGEAVQSVVAWTLQQPGNENIRSVNAVVGETNDGYLNDIRGMHVKRAHIVAAIEAAQASAEFASVVEGSVGAGTGTICFGFKGGIGTSSRVLPDDLGGYTIGALVQSNFGGVLMIDGARVGEAVGRYSFRRLIESQRENPTDGDPRALESDEQAPIDSPDGSCMIVLATDAPLSPRNLERLARRSVLGLARTGSFMSNGSGDFVIAFSTRNRVPYAMEEREVKVVDLHNDAMSPLFLAAVEAVEEAVYNSLTMATTVTGRDGHTVEAIPLGRLREILDD